MPNSTPTNQPTHTRTTNLAMPHMRQDLLRRPPTSVLTRTRRTIHESRQMSWDDYIKLGELRIRAERAEAQRDRLAKVGDQLADAVANDGLEPELLSEWDEARAWDGKPDTPPHTLGAPMSRRKGTKP